MEIEVLKPVTVDFKYTSFEIPVYREDFSFSPEDALTLNILFGTEIFTLEDSIECITIKGLIDLEEGKMMSWFPLNKDITIYTKVRDEGVYTLNDANTAIISEYRGYVPSLFECNENGYGDYFNMTIDKNGYIKNWHQHLDKKIQELIKKANH